MNLRTLAVVLLFAFSNVAQAQSGRVVAAEGAVTVERGAVAQALSVGSTINSGDVLVTEKGSVSVEMANGEQIQLKPQTRFSIDQFSMPTKPSNPATGRSFYSLVKGAFRVVTKSLGKRGLDSYRINTPVATIGIRGSVVIGAFTPAQGLGVGVEQGAAFVTNAAGVAEVPAGTFASVTGAATAPVASTTIPAVLSQAGFASVGGAAGGTAGAVGGIGGVTATTAVAVGTAAVIGAVVGVVVSEDKPVASTSTSTATHTR